MIAVVVDVGGELRLVAPPDHALLAARRGPPVHFQLQLVGLDQPRRIGEPLAECPEEEEEAMSLGLVVVEGGVGHRTAPAQDGAARQREPPSGDLPRRLGSVPAALVRGRAAFAGGAVGSLGYGLVRPVEGRPGRPADTLDLPDAVMMIADTLVILDNLFGRAIVVANVEVPPRAGPAERLRLYDAAEARLDDMIARLRQRHELAPLALRHGLPPAATDSRYPRDAFERDVARVLEYVAAGDTFQTVLSRRQEVRGAIDPLLLYRYLRALNPAPYLFYLALDDVALVGSS